MPIFFSQPINSGSLSSAHVTSIPSNPRSGLPLAHTAPKASPICLNGTRAIPRFAFFGGAGFRDRTISELSTAPNGESKVCMLSAFVREGCEPSWYFNFTVVSRVPVRGYQRSSNVMVFGRAYPGMVAQRRLNWLLAPCALLLLPSSGVPSPSALAISDPPP